MATVARRETPSSLAELFGWLEEGIPGISAWRAGAMRMRVEDFEEHGRYVVRAELPGIDPEKDVEVTVEKGVLSIRAERRDERKEKQRTEFHYGSFERRMTLPPTAREEGVEATYENGILTVMVPVQPAVPAKPARRIPVMRAPRE